MIIFEIFHNYSHHTHIITYNFIPFYPLEGDFGATEEVVSLSRAQMAPKRKQKSDHKTYNNERFKVIPFLTTT